MKTSYFGLTIFVISLFNVSTAYGQTADWYIAPAIVHTDDDGDRNIDDSPAGGQIAVGRVMTEHLSLEGALGYSDIKGFPDISVNVLAAVDRDRTFSPYLLFGIGYLGTSTDGGGDENRATGTLGVGLKWRMGQSNVSIRTEYRARLAWESANNFTDFITSIGVQYNFGSGKSATKSQPKFDTDGDGVKDHWDQCPATRRGVVVDENGCPPVSDRDDDSDGDRVGDKIDECPNTPSGTPVDPVGCSLDSDGDGVTSDIDRCPASSPGAVVDMYGCSRDDDQDGVPDHLDKCLNTARGVRIDVNGCEIKDVIKLTGVNFENNSDRIMLGTEQALIDAAATLKKNPELKVEVAGHTDSVGGATINESLSERRAKTVRNYLIRYGANAANLTARGYGESKPVSDNTSVRGRAANRRVELIILN